MENTEKNKNSDSEKDDLVIRLTQDRIQQELSNLSADELKANVLAGISVIFAILAVSEMLNFFKNEPEWYFILPYFVGLTLVVAAFVYGIVVLRPKDDRFELWLPKESDEEYKEKTVTEVKKSIKDDLISNFETIVNSRDRDAIYIKSGYKFLLFGSLAMLISLAWSNLTVI